MQRNTIPSTVDTRDASPWDTIPVPPSFLPLFLALLTVTLMSLGGVAAQEMPIQSIMPVWFVVAKLCAGAFLASLIFVQQFKAELERARRRLGLTLAQALEAAARTLSPAAIASPASEREIAYSGVSIS